MNGRVYDYNLGRFMSVDPFVHEGSQGINPYSYIMNNPLAGTDPTGYAPEKVAITGSRVKRDANKIGVSGSKITTGAGNLSFNGNVTTYSNDNGATTSNNSASSPNQNIMDIGGQEEIESGTNQDNSGFGVDDAASIGVGVTPAGVVADVYTAATGEDFFTGEEVSGFWRWAGLIPFVSELRKIANAADEGITVIRKGSDLTKSAADAAKRLGVNLDNINITDGIAKAKINLSSTLDPKDIAQLKDVMKARGATKAEIDTGFIANEKLDTFLRRRVQDGKPFYGGTVRQSSSKDSDFTINFDL
jgi:hypothetical protein